MNARERQRLADEAVELIVKGLALRPDLAGDLNRRAGAEEVLDRQRLEAERSRRWTLAALSAFALAALAAGGYWLYRGQSERAQAQAQEHAQQAAQMQSEKSQALAQAQAQRIAQLQAQVDAQKLAAQAQAQAQAEAQARSERKAAEGATKGNLASLRSALSIYYGDKDGIYPSSLAALTARGKHRPYLRRIPKAQMPPYHAASSAVHYGTRPNDSGGWLYDADSHDANWGLIWVNCTHTDSKASVWSSY